MTSQKELQQARDFMTFPPKIHNERKNENQHNFGRFEQSRQEVPGHGGCY